jgi:hypothetical protein
VIIIHGCRYWAGDGNLGRVYGIVRDLGLGDERILPTLPYRWEGEPSCPSSWTTCLARRFLKLKWQVRPRFCSRVSVSFEQHNAAQNSHGNNCMPTHRNLASLKAVNDPGSLYRKSTILTHTSHLAGLAFVTGLRNIWSRPPDFVCCLIHWGIEI